MRLKTPYTIGLTINKPLEADMTNRTIKHEIKLQKSVIVILGILAVGVFANAFAPAFDVKSAFANHNGVGGDLGTKQHPLHIVCRSGCR